jgi:thiol-disulfide isomerase/thioredoxin
VRPQHAAIAVLLVLATAVLAGCGGDPVTKQYVWEPDDSPVKVNTPELRQLKTRIGVEPCPRTTAPVSDGSRALPDITLPCLGGGRSVNVARLRGPLLLNFWAQWCQPCRDETDVLQQIADEYRGRVRVIGVDWQDTLPDHAFALLRKVGATYPQLADPEGATRADLQMQGLPYTFFVTPAGSVTYVNTGPLESADEVADLIQEHFGVPAPGGGT